MSTSSQTAKLLQDYNERTVVLLGGGLDGYAVLLFLKELGITNVLGLHVDYGQVSAEGECQTAKKQAELCGFAFYSVKDHGLIMGVNPQGSLILGDSEASPVTFARNLVLMLHAAKFGSTIYLGLDKPYTGGIPYFDCTLDYFDQAIKLVGNTHLKVAAPFVDTDKLEVCLYAIRRDPDFFENTFTCWTPDTVGEGYDQTQQECGRCKHCKIKAELKLKVEQYNQIQPHPQDEDPDHFNRYVEDDVGAMKELLTDETIRKPPGSIAIKDYDGPSEQSAYELKEDDLSMEEIERIMFQPVDDEDEES